MDVYQLNLIREKYRLIRASLDEKLRRHWAAAEASSLGRGGISCVSSATGLSRTTIRAGLRELRNPEPFAKLRRAGAGRKRLTELNRELEAALEALLEPVTRGDPCSALRSASESTWHVDH